MMRIHVVGGFLGAGKTTLLRSMATHLAQRGEQVAVITNDQGHALVDTSLCSDAAERTREITGGCFCCRFDELEAALVEELAAGTTVVLAEAVGSCTDLVATVLSPLADRHPAHFRLAPLAVVVDPYRFAELEAGALEDDVAYLFRKQIEEADVVLLSRADLAPPDVRAGVRAIRDDVAIVAVSGATGTGLAEWASATPARPSAPLDIDYDRYAAAEALLGWCNATVHLIATEAIDAASVARRFLTSLSDAPIAHVKLTGLEPHGGHAALVRAGGEPFVAFDADADATEITWLVNARVAIDPAALVERMQRELAAAAAPAIVTWHDVEAFRPSRPVPTFRHTFRCGSGDDASCCAAFYDRDDVRALLGDSWHPGGVELTLELARRMVLRPEAHVLDVACGKGASLRALIEELRVTAVGLDAEARGASDDRLTFVRGDAHLIPRPDASFDALLCECALSTFRDQPRALGEMRRVLRPGGRLAITDMAVEGPLPESLREWIHTGTCLAGALSIETYGAALRTAGFRIVEQWDASDALRELLRRIKRNLVGAAFAAATGNLGADRKIGMKRAREVLAEAARAIDAGSVRYAAFIAEPATS